MSKYSGTGVSGVNLQIRAVLDDGQRCSPELTGKMPGRRREVGEDGSGPLATGSGRRSTGAEAGVDGTRRRAAALDPRRRRRRRQAPREARRMASMVKAKCGEAGAAAAGAGRSGRGAVGGGRRRGRAGKEALGGAAASFGRPGQGRTVAGRRPGPRRPGAGSRWAPAGLAAVWRERKAGGADMATREWLAAVVGDVARRDWLG